MNLLSPGGVSGYCRVDWFTPPGLSAWGDGRTLVLCTEGYIEMRKYVDIARGGGERLYIADGEGGVFPGCRGEGRYSLLFRNIAGCAEPHPIRRCLCGIRWRQGESLSGPENG